MGRKHLEPQDLNQFGNKVRGGANKRANGRRKGNALGNVAQGNDDKAALRKLFGGKR